MSDARDERDDDEVVYDMDMPETTGFGFVVPKVAMWCGHCWQLSLWIGSDDELFEMLDELKDSDFVRCPFCGSERDIPDDIRPMFERKGDR